MRDVTRRLGFFLFALCLASDPSLGTVSECNILRGAGSTLLFPYFELDMDDAWNTTTLLSVTNEMVGGPLDTFGESVLTRVVLWTDWGVPTLAFDVYLGVFDTVTINVRDVFLLGNVVSTGENDWAHLANVPGCGSSPPFHENPALDRVQRRQLVAYHTGQPGPLDPRCAGEDHGDNVVRGYITVDAVSDCHGMDILSISGPPFNPSMPGYFDNRPPGGTAIVHNRLRGDILYIDSAQATAQGVEAVGVWADPEGKIFTPRAYTFYGRLWDWDARDRRMPLPEHWTARFLNGGPFAGNATLLFWQDVGHPDPAPLSCGSHPSWWPLRTIFHVHDEDGEILTPLLSPDLLPLATQRVSLTALGIPFPNGLIDLETWYRYPGDQMHRQSWLTVTLAAGQFSAAITGNPTNTMCARVPYP